MEWREQKIELIEELFLNELALYLLASLSSNSHEFESCKRKMDLNRVSSRDTTETAYTSDTLKLPAPDFIDSSVSKTSVFTNPFKQAEDAKQAILEKHVKMVNAKDNTQIINGKKVCWNYRKGKCRFGHNCIYAHDSDVQKNEDKINEENEVRHTVVCQSQDFSKNEEFAETGCKSKQTKKRPGLTQGLVPGKKIMKNYHKQQKTNCSNKK
ncbi:hypothetical protein FQR65_LT06194 [Abscondita terminalis]|nr:hypothetical protein FQR65_LT06194 [Abscondita terminalis]